MPHTLGIPNLGAAELEFVTAIGISDLVPNIPFRSFDDFCSFFNQASDKIFHKPGEHFHYFNGEYVIFGHVIEKVSQMSLVEYIDKTILSPLGMKRSTFLESDLQNDENVSILYMLLPDESGKFKLSEQKFPFSDFIYAPGGLLSSTNEMIKYIQMFMNHGILENRQIFDSGIIQEMQMMHFQFDEMLPIDAEVSGYGWGRHENFLTY